MKNFTIQELTQKVNGYSGDNSLHHTVLSDFLSWLEKKEESKKECIHVYGLPKEIAVQHHLSCHKCGKRGEEKTVPKIEENKIEAEVAVFWSMIASYLPKTVERSAFGDVNMFLAFKKVYPEIIRFINKK